MTDFQDNDKAFDYATTRLRTDISDFERNDMIKQMMGDTWKFVLNPAGDEILAVEEFKSGLENMICFWWP